MNTIEPHWEDKVWGRVQHLFASRWAATSFLQVKAGYCCSRHRHLYRANLFTVASGAIIVQQYGKDNIETTGLTLLRAGQTLIVPSLHWHRFRVVEAGDVVEVYWPDRERELTHLAEEAGVERYPEVSIDDIDRMPGSLGGEDYVDLMLNDLMSWGRGDEE